MVHSLMKKSKSIRIKSAWWLYDFVNFFSHTMARTKVYLIVMRTYMKVYEPNLGYFIFAEDFFNRYPAKG